MNDLTSERLRGDELEAREQKSLVTIRSLRAECDALRENLDQVSAPPVHVSGCLVHMHAGLCLLCSCDRLCIFPVSRLCCALDMCE
jgi:hypothetical protein